MTTPIEYGDTIWMDTMQFVSAFPELRDGLEKMQDHFKGLTGITIHLAEKTFVLNKKTDEGIPTWDDIDKDAQCRHADFFCECPAEAENCESCEADTCESEDYVGGAEKKEQ